MVNVNAQTRQDVKVNTKIGQDSSVKVVSSVGGKGIQGNQGAQGIQGPQGIDGLFAGQGTQGLQGAETQGSQGITGNEGSYGGTTFDYVYDSTTVDNSNPGTGRFKFNNLALNQATELYFSEKNADNINISAFINSLGTVSSTNKAYLTLRVSNDIENNFTLLVINGQPIDNGDYFTIPIDYVSGEPSYLDETLFNASFSRVGDRGSQGLQGAQGVQNTQGNQGIKVLKDFKVH